MFKCWSPKQLPPGQATILNQFYRSFTVFPGGRRKVWNVLEEKRVEGRWLCLCLTKSLWNLFCQLFSVIYCLHTHTHTYTLFRGLRSSFSSYFPLKNKLQLGATPLDEVLMSVHTPIHTHTHTHTHFNILRPGCFHHTCYFRSGPQCVCVIFVTYVVCSLTTSPRLHPSVKCLQQILISATWCLAGPRSVSIPFDVCAIKNKEKKM